MGNDLLNEIYGIIVYERIMIDYLSKKYSVEKETIKPRKIGCFIVDEMNKKCILIDWKEIDKVLPIPQIMKKHLTL